MSATPINVVEFLWALAVTLGCAGAIALAIGVVTGAIEKMMDVEDMLDG